MNDLKAAIDTINLIIGRLLVAIATSPSNEKSRKRDSGYVDALKTALTALRDAQARQEGCVSCKNRYWYFTDYRFNPNYCPSCGRSLEPVGNPDTLATVSKTERVEEEEP